MSPFPLQHPLWPFSDHLGTPRDIADQNESTYTTTVTNHRTYESFGNRTAETNSAVDLLFGFAGKSLDEDTGLGNFVNRSLDPTIGQWLSEDPIDFQGGDANLRRDVFNNPLSNVDPLGLSAEMVFAVMGPEYTATYDAGPWQQSTPVSDPLFISISPSTPKTRTPATPDIRSPEPKVGSTEWYHMRYDDWVRYARQHNRLIYDNDAWARYVLEQLRKHNQAQLDYRRMKKYYEDHKIAPPLYFRPPPAFKTPTRPTRPIPIPSFEDWMWPPPSAPWWWPFPIPPKPIL